MGILSLVLGAVGLLISIAGSCGPGHGQPIASRVVSGMLGGVPALTGMFVAIPMRSPSPGAILAGLGAVLALVGYQRLHYACQQRKVSTMKMRTIK